MLKENINTKDYWNGRFLGNNNKSWKAMSGEQQTTIFANEIVKRLNLPHNFDGTLLDFGCALGDAIPVYAQKYPHATVVGVDFSTVAIETCVKKYGGKYRFLCGNVDDIPSVDVIIASNVLEHITDDKLIAKKLLQKCSDLYIAVPFDEQLPDCVMNGEMGVEEHINSYNKSSFDEFDARNVVYICRERRFIGRLRSFVNIEIKNIVRPLLGKQKYFGGVYRQILFHLKK